MESEAKVMDDLMNEARIALAAKRASEHQLAAAAVYPQWRHAIFGLMSGAVVLAPILPKMTLIAVLVIVLGLVPLIMHADRRRTGMFINGYRRGKTRLVSFAIIAINTFLNIIGLYRFLEFGDRSAVMLLAAVAVAVGWIGSLIWQRVLLDELER